MHILPLAGGCKAYEIFFYNTCNNFKTVIKTMKRRTISILRDLEKRDRDIIINKVKVYIEYVDDKNYILTNKLPGRNSIKAAVRYVSSLLYKFKRRVRIKKIGLYFFHTLKGADYLWPVEEPAKNLLFIICFISIFLIPPINSTVLYFLYAV